MAIQTRDWVAVGGAVVLIGGGIVVAQMISRKAATFRLGDEAALSSLIFKYRGPDLTAYVGWGLREGDFDNGLGLVGQMAGLGGPFDISRFSAFDQHELNRLTQPEIEAFTLSPILVLDGAHGVEAKEYDTFVWLTTNEADPTNELYIIGMTRQSNTIDVKE